MKTFVFFIGGTGARVLRSMTMLLASGVTLKQKGDTIVPIIVDFDATNADMHRSNNLLGTYNSLHAICDYSRDEFEGGFFKTPLGIQEDGHYREFVALSNMTFNDEKNTFGKFIGYDSLESISKSTKLLIDSLYDTSSDTSRDRELNLELQYGFKGNPNIGSVVFNEYFKTDQYKNFKDSFNPGDRVFIVASIFGGTGSSGLPQLVKKIREDVQSKLEDDGSIKAIREAMLGACVVLPYFKVKEDSNSAVNSLTFNSKAKAALNYYYDEINNLMSEVYYIGCKEQNSSGYDNIEGGEKQENKAHLVEMLSAMSIIEFANHDELQPDAVTKFYEYTTTSVEGAIPNPAFQDLLAKPGASHVYQTYMKKLNAFALFVKYFQDYTRKECNKGFLAPKSSYYKNLKDFVDPGKEFSEKLNDFANRFIDWTNELAQNAIFGFEPYNFGKAKKLDELIKLDNSNKYPKKNFDDEITRILNSECSKENTKDSNGAKTYLRHAYTACFEAVSKIN